MIASLRTSATSSAVISGSGLAMAKMIGLSAMDFTMSFVTAPFADRPKNTSAPRSARLPLIHTLGATLIDDALGIAEDEVFGAKADSAQQFETGDAGGAGAVADELGCFDITPGEVERVEQAGGGADGGAVLVVMKARDVEQFTQLLLDDETFRRLDILEIDAAPTLAEQFDAIDEFVGIFGRDFKIDRIDIGKALEQRRLAFHHRLRRQRTKIAEAENGGAVGDDGDEIALGRVVVGERLIRGDGQHRDGDAGRIGERKVALRRHRLG